MTLFSSAQGGGGAGGGKVMNFGKSRARMTTEKDQKYTFKDVAGLDEEKEDMAEIVDFLKAPRKYTKLGARIFGAVKPAEYFLLALVSPVIYNFAVDSDGVDDNRGTLPGYGTAGLQNNSYNVIENIHGILNNAMKYISMFLSIIIRIIYK